MLLPQVLLLPQLELLMRLISQVIVLEILTSCKTAVQKLISGKRLPKRYKIIHFQYAASCYHGYQILMGAQFHLTNVCIICWGMNLEQFWPSDMHLTL